MEGLSKITYQGKEIVYVDFSFTGGTKEKTLPFMKAVETEYLKYPPKSLLVITNVEGFHFDKDILNAMKEQQNATASRQKKNAIIGMKPIHKAAFNFLFAISAGNSLKVFNTELEAKEWLVSD